MEGQTDACSLSKSERPLEHDKMYKELGMLQEKIVALENKLKKTNCVGLDYRSLVTSTVEQTEKPDKNVSKSPLNESCCSSYEPRNTSNPRLTRTPAVNPRHYSRPSDTASERREKYCHTHTNSAAKPLLCNRSFSNIPADFVKASPKPEISTGNRGIARGSTKKMHKREDKENMSVQNSMSHHRSMQVLEKKRLDSKKPPAKYEPKPLAKPKTTPKVGSQEPWKVKYDKLKVQHDKLSADYKELAENYKLSEQLRKQQRKRIKELEKKLKVPAEVASVEAVNPASCISVNVKKKAKSHK